jgi:hypothetical protein
MPEREKLFIYANTRKAGRAAGGSGGAGGGGGDYTHWRAGRGLASQSVYNRECKRGHSHQGHLLGCTDWLGIHERNDAKSAPDPGVAGRHPCS